jgi:hypothetical protein
MITDRRLGVKASKEGYQHYGVLAIVLLQMLLHPHPVLGDSINPRQTNRQQSRNFCTRTDALFSVMFNLHQQFFHAEFFKL